MTTQPAPRAYVCFADRTDARNMSEDAICYSVKDATKHVRELKEMGFTSATFVSYDNEEAFYSQRFDKVGY